MKQSMIKSIKKLISNLDYEILDGELSDFEINKLCYDSRIVENDDLFICLKGARFDTHSIIPDIIKKGAKVIIVDKDSEYVAEGSHSSPVRCVEESTASPTVGASSANPTVGASSASPIVEESTASPTVGASSASPIVGASYTSPVILAVENTRIALAIISANYFDRPADKLKIVGITGTKGKTTTAFMIRNILKEAGHKVGMIGTIGIFYGDEHVITDNTTPESFVLQEYFRKMLDMGIDYVVMEVSSQSLKYHRVYGINFYYAVFTNIMPEHIGEHEHTDYNDYLESKLKIFEQCENALINAGTNDYDRVIRKIKGLAELAHTNGASSQAVGASCTSPQSVGASCASPQNVGASCTSSQTVGASCVSPKLYEKKINRKFNLRIPGEHNLENASLAYEFGKSLGLSDNIIIRALEETVVPGRIEEVYRDDDFTVIVDFSYEDNGAKRLFDVLRKENYKRIVAVFGCGGNRSKNRRYGMGELCGKEADFIVLTADNSRFEKTRDIIRDIESTLTKYKKENDLENGYVIIEDRYKAIEYAIANRKKGDVICVMGKGHELLWK